MGKNIVLTGFMMAGKTSIATELSKITGRKLFDSDQVIVDEAGMSINRIFEKFGEGYFRDLEAEVIKKLSELEDAIISTGGGVVLREENISELRKNGVIVNINITPEVIKSRLMSSKGSRPLIKDSGFDDVLARLDARREFYKNCDFMVDARNDSTPKEQAELILNILKRNGEI